MNTIAYLEGASYQLRAPTTHTFFAAIISCTELAARQRFVWRRRGTMIELR